MNEDALGRMADSLKRAKGIQRAVDEAGLGTAERPTKSDAAVKSSASLELSGQQEVPVSVFVSWAHSHHTWDRSRIERWERAVAEFTTTLRQDGGLDADVDLYHLSDPTVDWTRLGPGRIAVVDFTVVVMSRSWAERWSGTNRPTEGAGAAAEADTLHGLFNRNQNDWQRRLKIVQFPDSDGEVPPELERVVRFHVDPEDFSTYEDLIRTLTNQPTYEKPPLAKVPTLPSAVLKGARKGPKMSGLAPTDTARLVAELKDIDGRLSAGDASVGDRDALVQRKSVLQAVLDALTKSD